MLGPREKPEWGGFLLEYLHDAYDFFDEEPANVKEEDSKRKSPELIVLADSEDDGEEADSEDDGEEEQLCAEPTAREHDGPRRLPRKVRVPEDPRTAAQVLHAVAKDMKRYKVEDLARLVKALEGKGRGDAHRAYEKLGGLYKASGKDYGVGASGSSWAALFYRNRESYQICIDKIRRGDKSLDDLVLMGVAGPSKPKKRAFSTIQETSDSADDLERGGRSALQSKDAFEQLLSTVFEHSLTLPDTLVPQLVKRIGAADTKPQSHSEIIDLAADQLQAWPPLYQEAFIDSQPRIGEVQGLSVLTGPRYVVFVDVRSRADIVPRIEETLRIGPAEEGHEPEPVLETVILLEVKNEEWQSELKWVIEDVVHIAKARLEAQLGEQ
ncbi:hypothetical protein FRC04_012072 [Tulasnella sp. 424]|nr:hypothetical protein FRC04_012072 [Tulasnella sp. 424]